MVGVVVALISEWLTPASLFILLNIVIATILVSSNKNLQPKDHHDPPPHQPHPQAPQPHPQPQLARAPSFFTRVTSFNLSSHYFHHHHPNPEDQPVPAHLELEQAEQPDPPRAITRTHSLLSRVASFKIPGLSRADPAQTAEELPDQGEELEKKVKKKSKEGEKRRDVKKNVAAAVKKGGGKPPAAAVRRGTTSLRKEWDDEVDAKADDFINRFKQQLKLQRLESLLRYRNTTTAAS